MEKDKTFEGLLEKEYAAIEDLLIDDCGLDVAVLEACGSSLFMEALLTRLARYQELTSDQIKELNEYSLRAARLFASAPHVNQRLLAGLMMFATVFDTRLSDESSFASGLIPSWPALVEYVSLSANFRGRMSEALRAADGIDRGTNEMLEQMTDSFSALYLKHLATQADLGAMAEKVKKSQADRRKGADAANAENRRLKADVFAWLDAQPPFKKIEGAASAITRQQPIKHTTARNWFKEWKKLRSASGE